MAKWNVGMEGEKDGWTELPDGDHVAEIKNVRLVDEEESGSGNPYFLWTLGTKEGDLDVRTTLIKGKRWLLKQMLLACGIESKDDDPEKKYAFSPENVIEKTIIIQIKNKPNSYTNKDGEKVENTKSEVRRVKPYKIEKSAEKVEKAEVVDDEEIPF